MRKCFLKSKKSLLDIPLAILLKLFVGISTMILIILPLLSIFFTDDYNRDVALDVVNSLYDFIDYKTETYNAAGGSQCVDIFKLEYLSNPQILHSNYKNYVISITGDNTGNLDKIGLINYDDFEKIRAGEDLGRDFDSFENLYFEDDVDFNFFTFEEDSTPPNQIYAIFLVPSIKVESLTARSFTGDSIAGYYIYYLRDDIDSDGKLNLEPAEGTYKNLVNWITGSEIPAQARNYHVGFFRQSGLNFGIVEKHPTLYSPLESCRLKPQEIPTGELADPNTNVDLLGCLLNDGKTISIYWDNENNDQGYQCFSDLSFGREICEEFQSNFPDYFSNDVSRENLELREQIFNSFTDFLASNEYIDENYDTVPACELCSPENDCRYIDRTLTFNSIFEKIDDDELFEFTNQNKNIPERSDSEEEIHGIYYGTLTSYCEERYSSVELDGNIVSPDVLCRQIVNYNYNYIFYISPGNNKKNGFYKFKNIEDINFAVVENTKTAVLGGIDLEPREITLDDVIRDYRIGSTGSDNKDFISLRFRDNFFEEGNEEFNAYIPASLFNSRFEDLLAPDFEDYFIDVTDSPIKGGDNNAVEIIDGRQYILNPRTLNIRLDEFFEDTRYSSFTLLFSFYLNLQREFLDYGGSEEITFNTKQIDFSFEGIERFSYPVSFEQILLSFYEYEDSTLESVKEDIENKNLKFIKIQLENGDDFYQLSTQDNKPLFIQKQFENEGNIYFYPAGLRDVLGILNNPEIPIEVIEAQLREQFRNQIQLILPEQENGNIVFENIEHNVKFSELAQIFRNPIN